MERQIVIDTSAVLAVILEARRLSHPGVFDGKSGNAYSALLKRKRLSHGKASKGLSVFGTIPVQEMDAPLADALELCDRHDLCAYDAYYLQLAK